MVKQSTAYTARLIITACIGIIVGWCANTWYQHHFVKFKAKRVTQRGFQFISPLLDIELPEGYDVRHDPIPFKHVIDQYVQEQLREGCVKDISVYFRDLSDGPWFGINNETKYNPASMMKIPIMVLWLKRAEKDPSVLQHRFTFDEKKYPASFRGYEPPNSMKSGVSYTVEELLRYMMNFSDNRALWLLHTSVPRAEYDAVLANMDIIEKQHGNDDYITVHGYSGFLRILYNASFLNKEMSEKALKIMSFQGFPNGMAAGVPAGTRLASKFGEYFDQRLQQLIQLHEFGIVYHPKGPYILGIMTRGCDVNKQAEVIKSISHKVYDAVNNQVVDNINGS